MGRKGWRDVGEPRLCSARDHPGPNPPEPSLELNSQQRHISFTVDGLTLSRNGNGPADALEVALLDAASLRALDGTQAGPKGWSR